MRFPGHPCCDCCCAGPDQEDASMADSEYTVELVQNFGTTSSTQIATDGNLQPCREVIDSSAPNQGVQRTFQASHFHNDSVWNPLLFGGPLRKVQVALDAKLVSFSMPPFDPRLNWGVNCKQNGHFFSSTGGGLFLLNPASGWHRSCGDSDALSFSRIFYEDVDGGGSAFDPDPFRPHHPDFSANGSPITFGWGTGSTLSKNVGQRDRTQRFDNYCFQALTAKACPECSGGESTFWDFTVSGVTNSSCAECAQYNGKFTIAKEHGCLWYDGTYDLCSADRKWVMTYNATASTWQLIAGWAASDNILGPTHAAVYNYSGLSFDCNDCNTFTLNTNSGKCSNWPTTIEVCPTSAIHRKLRGNLGLSDELAI